MYIHERKEWPSFIWDQTRVTARLLIRVIYKGGSLAVWKRWALRCVKRPPSSP